MTEYIGPPVNVEIEQALELLEMFIRGEVNVETALAALVILRKYFRKVKTV